MRLNENNTFIGINPPYQLSVIHSRRSASATADTM